MLERSYSVKVSVEELEGFEGPEDVDVDFRRVLKEARRERAQDFRNGMSFLVAGWSRWDKIQQKSAMDTRFVGICK